MEINPSADGVLAKGVGRPFSWLYQRVIWPLATVLLLFVGTVMLWEAIDRTFRSHSYIWSEETIRYSLLWIVFLCFGLAGVRQQHLRSDLLLRSFPKGVQRVCGVIGDLAGLVFCALLLYGALVQLNQLYDTEMMTEALFDTPLWVIFLVVPIGAALYGMYYLLSLFGLIPREAADPHEIPLID